jgi:hypothetical protein
MDYQFSKAELDAAHEQRLRYVRAGAERRKLDHAGSIPDYQLPPHLKRLKLIEANLIGEILENTGSIPEYQYPLHIEMLRPMKVGIKRSKIENAGSIPEYQLPPHLRNLRLREVDLKEDKFENAGSIPDSQTLPFFTQELLSRGNTCSKCFEDLNNDEFSRGHTCSEVPIDYSQPKVLPYKGDIATLAHIVCNNSVPDLNENINSLMKALVFCTGPLCRNIDAVRLDLLTEGIQKVNDIIDFIKTPGTVMCIDDSLDLPMETNLPSNSGFLNYFSENTLNNVNGFQRAFGHVANYHNGPTSHSLQKEQ